jgi:uncharacterized protein with HEPN domain
MRHLLVHEYERVDWNLVWETITIHVPAFLALVEPLVPELPADETGDNPL